MSIFTEKLREVLQSVLPITALVVLLHFTLTPLETIDLQRFLFGAFLIIIGLSIFLFGVDLGITPIGKFLGKGLARSNSSIGPTVTRNSSTLSAEAYPSWPLRPDPFCWMSMTRLIAWPPGPPEPLP